jgi:hypothetical protein
LGWKPAVPHFFGPETLVLNFTWRGFLDYLFTIVAQIDKKQSSAAQGCGGIFFRFFIGCDGGLHNSHIPADIQAGRIGFLVSESS